MSLKALAHKVLERNSGTDICATHPGFDRNSGYQPRPKPPIRSATEWSNETTALVEWFLTTEPPPRPFPLFPHVIVANPVHYWNYLRADIAAGPGVGRAYYGAFQKDLRRLAELMDGPKSIR